MIPKYINSKECLNLLLKSNQIVITTHTNPDGDAIGSEMGLYYFLVDIGKNVVVINDSFTPSNLEFLDPLKKIRVFNYQDDLNIIINSDLIVILDLNVSKRLKSMEEIITRSKNNKLLIDHHINPSIDANYYFVDTDATSTGELIWEIIKKKVNRNNKNIAESLYTAIITDTGSFRFPKTDSNILRIAADLLEMGADPVKCYDMVYNQNSLSAMLIKGEALANIKLYFNNQISVLKLTKEMFEKTKATIEDTDNLVEYTLFIKDVKLGIFISYLYDRPEIRVSFRSKKDFLSARELAQIFGGGGHEQAAGARLFNVSIDEAESIILNEVEKKIKYYNLYF